MTATMHITSEIADFARRVREQLSDLPADEVEELTDGLEADLAEALAEDLKRELPDAKVYATELRNAAGLPESVAVEKRGIGNVVRGLGVDIGLKRAQVAAELRKSSILAGLLDFLVALRPAWWILRAWVAFQLAAHVFGFKGPVLPQDIRRWLVLVLFAVISVQWGRRKWLPFKSMAAVIFLGNLFAAFWLLPMAYSSSDWARHDIASTIFQGVPEPVQGLAIDGQQIGNVFAFDAAGNPLTNVQLFDEKGRPLALAENVLGSECDDPCQVQYVKMPSTLDNGRIAWNVFPMQRINADDTVFDDVSGLNKPAPGSKLEDAVLPFLKVPAVFDGTKDVAKGNG